MRKMNEILQFSISLKNSSILTLIKFAHSERYCSQKVKAIPEIKFIILSYFTLILRLQFNAVPFSTSSYFYDYCVVSGYRWHYVFRKDRE